MKRQKFAILLVVVVMSLGSVGCTMTRTNIRDKNNTQTAPRNPVVPDIVPDVVPDVIPDALIPGDNNVGPNTTTPRTNGTTTNGTTNNNNLEQAPVTPGNNTNNTGTTGTNVR